MPDQDPCKYSIYGKYSNNEWFDLSTVGEEPCLGNTLNMTN